jgi:cation diffusion facilitator CzcD-associated flavoprotein CzcO
LIVSTGINEPNIPKHLMENQIDGYESVELDLDYFKGKSVLILGKGNSAFELAQSIYGVTNFVHLISRSQSIFTILN